MKPGSPRVRLTQPENLRRVVERGSAQTFGVSCTIEPFSLERELTGNGKEPMLPSHRENVASRGDARTRDNEEGEATLLARVAAGDSRAFEALYRIYHPRLTRFLDRMTRHAGLVEEAVNDTMYVVWNRAASYNGASKVSTWVFAIAYRKALKALSAGRRQHESLDELTPQDHPVDSGPGPEECFADRQDQVLVARALETLSAEHRAVVELAYFHGIGYREIAEVVGCPPDTVKTRMFHARRRLRLALLSANGKDRP